MTDRPILFSAPMVRALLAGTKTQTRRMLRGVPPSPGDDAVNPRNTIKHEHAYFDSYRNAKITPANPAKMSENWCWWTRDDRQCLPTVKVKFVPGDKLWVRETWAYNPDHPTVAEWACFRADPGHDYDIEKWRSSIHMPRRASRITLTITDVRVERLNSISEADALAEGMELDRLMVYANCPRGADRQVFHDRFFYHDGPDDGFETATKAYANLWNEINGPGSWEQNPWVVALTFTVEARNIDAGVSDPETFNTQGE